MRVRRSSLIGALLGLALLPAAAPAQGGATFLAAGDVDYLDPGLTYYTFGYQVVFAVNRPLYSFRPGDVTPVPDLAESAPEISADNRQITVRIRPGVHYAPPVNREVVAADVEYAFERSFSRRVPSGYATAYFRALEGAPREPTRTVRDIAGVSAPDARTLVLRLKKPVAQQVAAALVMPITVPVPREYAAPYDGHTPSTYDQAPATTGPYMVERRRPNRVIQLVRNPNWNRATDFRPAYLDTITVDEGNGDLGRAANRALTGSRQMCCDAGAPPLRTLRAALRDRPSQVQRVAGGGTRWIAFNTRIKPFNKVGVRRGIVAGMNRERLLATRGGRTVGSIAQHYLPPGLPGHELTDVSGLDFLRNPKGDRALARRYFRQAKLRRPRKRLLMVGSNANPGLATAREAARQLRRLGFRTRLRIVPQDTLYTRFCGVPRARVAICPNVGWFKDFHDAESMLRLTFHGGEITRFGNVNWSQLRVPSINRAMDAAAQLPLGPDRDRAFAAVNRDISAQAPGVPYAWDDSFQVASADLETPMNPYFTTIDLSFVRPR